MHYWNQEEREENAKRYKTAPFDPRFPSTNQAKRCWVNYVDYWKCMKAAGDDGDSTQCDQFKFVYSELCPNKWVEDWNDQREEGRFPIREINEVEPKF